MSEGAGHADPGCMVAVLGKELGELSAQLLYVWHEACARARRGVFNNMVDLARLLFTNTEYYSRSSSQVSPHELLMLLFIFYVY